MLGACVSTAAAWASSSCLRRLQSLHLLLTRRWTQTEAPCSPCTRSSGGYAGRWRRHRSPCSRSLLRRLCWQMAAGAAGTSRALGETGRAQEARGTRAEPFVGSCTSAQRTAMAVDRARDEWTRRWRRRDGRERDSRVERELEQANIGSSSPRRII